MKFETKILDMRFTGYPHWKYYVSVSRIVSADERVDMFVLWREWCWTTWGASKELDFYYYTLGDGPCHNAHWCWSSEYERRRIYLATDVDLMEFTLRWA